MEVEELKNILIWRVYNEDDDDDCLYIVMEEGELIFLKEIPKNMRLK